MRHFRGSAQTVPEAERVVAIARRVLACVVLSASAELISKQLIDGRRRILVHALVEIILGLAHDAFKLVRQLFSELRAAQISLTLVHRLLVIRHSYFQ